MYEVTFVIEGIPKTMQINAEDEIAVQNIVTNMYLGGKIEIIDIRRV